MMVMNFKPKSQITDLIAPQPTTALKMHKTITTPVMPYISVTTVSILLNFPDASPVDVALPQQTI